MTVDTAFSLAAALVADVSTRIAQIATEEDARVQLINRFLTEILGWRFSEIATEPHSPAGYADYLLKCDQTPSLVIEAKRTGAILVDTANDRLANYKVSGPALVSAGDGIKQAISYSMDHGVDFAVLTTGTSWIAFITFPGGGKSYRDGKAIVFPNLEAILKNFAVFYDLFSREAVSRKLYKVHFARAEGLEASNFEPLISVNRQADLRMLPKTPLAQDLDPVFREFFGVMSGEHDKEMLLHCFVESRESRNADASLQKIIGNIAGSVDTISTDTGEQLTSQIENIIDTKRGENILIVGNKGAGKSTFVERFFRLVLAPEYQSKCLIIRVDFLPSTGEVNGLATWITEKVKKEVERQLFKDGIASYDELQGLYFRDYQKWMNGQFKPLYESNKVAFKIKFGEHLNERINSNPHEYLLNILHDVVHNRKLLPVFIFDNTDHHSESFQEAVFQWSQSIRLEVPFSLVVLPITDRTIWKMSKHGPFQTYESKLFYLPVPSTRDVLDRRISYLKEHAGKAHGAKSYFSGKGIRLSVENIIAFAACTEEIFIKEEFISRRIGWLSNHDIRRGLLLSKNVITSPFLSIDELMSAYIKRVSGNTFSVSYRKFMQALVLGDYNSFQQGDSPFVVDIFHTTAEFPTSPFLRLSILKLLIDKAGDGDGLSGYTPLPQIALYFAAMGVSEDALNESLSALLDYRLIEPFDASSSQLSPDQRLAVAHSGRMHFEMALTDPLYVSQMAFSTPLRSQSVVDRLRTLKNGKMANSEWDQVRRIFLLYCFAQDRTLIRIPKDPMFDGQRQFRRDLNAKWVGAAPLSDDTDGTGSIVAPSPQAHSHVTATVNWFDTVKGFGFLDAGLGADVFLHINAVRRAGMESVGIGDVVICDIAMGKEGRLQAIQVHSIEPTQQASVDENDPALTKAEVVFYNAQKGYGFVRVEGVKDDIYLSAGVFQKSGIAALGQGDMVKVILGEETIGRGQSVKLLRAA